METKRPKGSAPSPGSAGSGRLQGELRKRRPFDDPCEEVVLNLLRTHDQIQIRFARLFAAYGLTSQQYNVLRILRGAGLLPILEIAAQMIAVVPGITGLVDRLEAKELVRRERCQDDRRVVYAAITPQGLALLGRLDDPVKELHHALVGHLTPSELDSLARLLEKARAHLSEPTEA